MQKFCREGNANAAMQGRAFGCDFGSHLFTTSPSRETRNLVKFHFKSLVRMPPCLLFRNPNTGSAAWGEAGHRDISFDIHTYMLAEAMSAAVTSDAICTIQLKLHAARKHGSGSHPWSR